MENKMMEGINTNTFLFKKIKEMQPKSVVKSFVYINTIPDGAAQRDEEGVVHSIDMESDAFITVIESDIEGEVIEGGAKWADKVESYITVFCPSHLAKDATDYVREIMDEIRPYGFEVIKGSPREAVSNKMKGTGQMIIATLVTNEYFNGYKWNI